MACLIIPYDNLNDQIRRDKSFPIPMRYLGKMRVITIIITPKLRDTHRLVGHQIDDATQIEKTVSFIVKCMKITVDPLEYGIGNITI